MINNEERQYNYVVLAENAYINNNRKKSIEFYKKALSFEGRIEDTIAILYNIAEIYDEMDNLEEALNSYKEITKLDDKEAGAYYGVAMIYEKMEEFQIAVDFYHRAIEIDPEYDRAYYYAANIIDEQGDKHTAIKYYHRVLEIVPDDFVTYNNIGAIYEELEQYEEALTMVKKSLSIEPTYYKALFNMGVINKALGKPDIALEYYFKTIEVDPTYWYSYLNISAIYIEFKQYEKSIELLNQGINHCEDAHDLYYNRACCYSILGKEQEAIKDIKKSLKLLPDIIEYVKTDDDFKNLYSNKEFKTIIEE